jgi:hypothetical protein
MSHYYYRGCIRKRCVDTRERIMTWVIPCKLNVDLRGPPLCGVVRCSRMLFLDSRGRFITYHCDGAVYVSVL